MNKKRVFRYILTFFFLLFFVRLSGAQEGSLVLSKTERRYIQRLVWVGDEYTLRYEIQIEKEERGSYTRVRRVYTGESFIELSLQPGNYRCRVIPYDFLNRPGEGSAWMVFEIPVVIENEGPEPSIAEIEPEGPEPEPKEPEPETKKQIKYNKPFDIYFSGALMPVFPFYGQMDQYSLNDTLCVGGLRLGIVSSVDRSLSLGAEFLITRSLLTVDSDTYEDSAELSYVGTIEFCLLAQKWFPKRITALTLHVGGGYISFEESFSSSIDGYRDYVEANHVNLGVSFLWRPMQHLIIETGLDYIFLFKGDSPGFLRPWFGIGMRF
jgi:hypothetical protein